MIVQKTSLHGTPTFPSPGGTELAVSTEVCHQTGDGEGATGVNSGHAVARVSDWSGPA